MLSGIPSFEPLVLRRLAAQCCLILNFPAPFAG
jgi:hypothetical protein